MQITVKGELYMHIFDYSFLSNFMLPANVLNITATIYELNAKALNRKENHLTIFTELEKIAKIQSVKNSNAIEGIITSDERIRAIVTQSSAPLNHDEAEIAGYRDALNQIHENYKNLSFGETSILNLHKLLLSHSGYQYGGQYKTDDNLILEIDKSGRRNIRFKPIPADETQEAMEQLIYAYLDARDNANINQLLLIPCVILDFLYIHPFKDGNGRISRLLSLLLLYKSGFDAGKYISFEEQINKYKNQYYEALKRSSQGWHDNTNDYTYFVQNFLQTLYMCYSELDKRFAVINSKKVTKKGRIEATVLNSLTPISKKELLDILPDASATTIEAVLGKMVKEGRITKLGTGRNTKYIYTK